MKPRIIYEDDAVIVAYKPVGLATQTARVGQPDMVSELKKAMSAGYLGVVHRLDQPVEGLLVFGKNQRASAELSRQLLGGTLNKQYFAVICGQPSEISGELVDYLGKGKDNRAFVADPPSKGQKTDVKKAVLQYKILEKVSIPTALALADIHIDTGRFHQIRCQMAHAGMPLLGDSKYGTGGQKSVALCAYKLQFQHPVTKRKMSYEIKPENEAFSCFSENNFGCDCLY